MGVVAKGIPCYHQGESTGDHIASLRRVESRRITGGAGMRPPAQQYVSVLVVSKTACRRCGDVPVCVGALYPYLGNVFGCNQPECCDRSIRDRVIRGASYPAVLGASVSYAEYG